MGTLLRLLLLCLAVVATVGCNDDLPKATEIARMRVLGAQLQVVGDEARTTPRPGESVHLTMPTVFPKLDGNVDDVQSLLIRCTAPTQFTGGLPICQEFLDAALGDDAADVATALDTAERFTCAVPLVFDSMGVTLACLTGEPDVELSIPEDFEADNALYLGVVCEDGAPFIDPTEPTLFGCDGDADAESILVNGQIQILRDDTPANHNPPIEALSLEFDSDIQGYMRGEWLPPDEETELTDTQCERNADEERLRDVVGGRHEIMVRWDPDAREELEDGTFERVEITIFATDGEMERRFTLFDELDEPVARLDADGDPILDDDDEPIDPVFEQPIDWDPPRWVPEDEWTDAERESFEEKEIRPPFQNRLVRFFITVRDGRGGFAMTTRAICVR